MGAHSKSQGLKYKLWIAYILLSIIPTLFFIYLLSNGFIVNLQKNNITANQLITLGIGIGAIVLMSISALFLLYRPISSLDQISKKTMGLVKEYIPKDTISDATDEVERLNLSFMGIFKEVQLKVHEANKYAQELSELNQKLLQMAVKDGLTSLYNQIYIKERLDNELKRAQQFNQPLAIMMIDIDNFKKINDSYGHLVGDNCLQAISRLIKDSIRNIDIPARYGGEEFLVILPNTKSDEAFKIAEKVRQYISDHPLQTMSSLSQNLIENQSQQNNKTVSITVSIGVECYSQISDIQTTDELIRASDNALYQAKKKGKNQVSLAV
ncbi:MAG: GGDEF domain-containing protein [Planctomycetota bacterium]